MGCSSLFCKPGAIALIALSAAPPGIKGTIIFMGFSGQAQKAEKLDKKISAKIPLRIGLPISSR
jgi:hypothetical protein